MSDDSQLNFARTVRWVVLLFLGFVVLQNSWRIIHWGDHEPETPARPAETTAAATPIGTIAPPQPQRQVDCSGSGQDNFSFLAMPMLPVPMESVSITDTKLGEGQPAVCGQKVTLRYQYASPEGTVFFSNLKQGAETKDVRLGTHEVLRGMETGIVGMKLGGERMIGIPATLALAKPEFTEKLRDRDALKDIAPYQAIIAKVALLSATPPLPESGLPLRRIQHGFGEGHEALCGEQVHVLLTLWKLDGTQLYTTGVGKPLSFTLGKSEVPLGIEMGVSEMVPGSSRSLIIPPAYMKPLDASLGSKNLLADANLPEDEIIMADLRIVVSPEAAAAGAKAAESAEQARRRAVEAAAAEAIAAEKAAEAHKAARDSSTPQPAEKKDAEKH